MISPADARKLTLDAPAAGDQHILESTEFDITSWSAKHIPPIFTVAFASLGAEDLQDLLGLSETDLEKIEMPPLKRRRILRQIEEDMVTYGLGKPSDDCLLLLSSISCFSCSPRSDGCLNMQMLSRLTLSLFLPL